LELKNFCRDSTDPTLYDLSKGTFFFEISALEIQMLRACNEYASLKEVFELNEKFTGVIVNPRVNSVI
jgi:hypothetical protein